MAIERKMSADELRWQAEEDARTMARYQEILDDKSRHKRAVAKAKELANDLNKRASIMNKASNASPNK